MTSSPHASARTSFSKYALISRMFRAAMSCVAFPVEGVGLVRVYGSGVGQGLGFRVRAGFTV